MVTERPERVCGIHFFNPAPAMSLVELVPAITTSDATLAEARAFVEACGKTAVTVKDQAGFVVNALLFPYLNNAVRLFDAGVASRDDIDAAMKGGCNFPMGPLELLDLVGLDTSLAILDALYAEFHDPNFAPAPLLRRMVAAERLGRKSGAGFYEYAASERFRDRPTPHRGGECDRGGPTLVDADVLRPFVRARVERALPLQPGQGSDRPVGGVRPPHADRVRRRPPARPGRGRARSACRCRTSAPCARCSTASRSTR